MFMQLLQTQASVPATQAPNIKSKCTTDLEVFTGENFCIKISVNVLKLLDLISTLT